jgi:hypothetical protein
MRTTSRILATAGLLMAAFNVSAQPPAQPAQPAAPALKPPPLFFRESFKARGTTSPENLFPANAANANLELKQYGAGSIVHPDRESGLQIYTQQDPLSGTTINFFWSGMAEGSWAVTLRDKANFVDLTGPAKIKWRVRMRGLHMLRPVVRLADGAMLVGDYTEPESTYWRENEFYLVDVPRWRVLDDKQVIGSTDAAWRVKPDLSRVDEVGFTDLVRGAGHGQGGNSGLDWIEVYGNPVKRSGT